jgi:hypothetical protein
VKSSFLVIRKTWLVLLAALIICLASSLVSATVIGANKGVINYKNVLKNGYAQELVTLTTDTDFNLSIDYKAEGDVASWLRFEPVTQPFFISRDHPYTIAIIIEPPPDTQIEHYTGSVRFMTGALAGPEGQFGTAVRTAINIRLGADITGQQILSCSASNFRIDDVEEGYPFEFYGIVTNNGNVRIKPDFVLEFWNQDQSKLIQTLRFTSNESVLPTVQKSIFASLRHNLPIGQYWVKIRTPICGEGESGFLTVSVIERGGVSDKGELVGIQNSPWVKVGEIVPIDALFQNLGSRVVSAKFKGTINSGDEIFKIIDTDPVDVMPGETARLRTYFNPDQEGQYMVTGRVLYNKKLTFEKSSVINVKPAGGSISLGSGSTHLILIILVVIILILFVLIFRKRKKKKN